MGRVSNPDFNEGHTIWLIAIGLLLLYRFNLSPQVAYFIMLWRTDRDSNPGYLAVYTLSKRAPSATRPSVRSIDDLPNFSR
jgi:hypothetical protein